MFPLAVSYTHLAAIKEAQAEKERPTLIIGKTVMGKGARKADGSSYEANCATPVSYTHLIQYCFLR